MSIHRGDPFGVQAGVLGISSTQVTSEGADEGEKNTAVEGLAFVGLCGSGQPGLSGEERPH